MFHLRDILRRTLRHALTGVAVVCVLLMSLRIHVHDQADGCLDHDLPAAEVGLFNDDHEADDEEGCGHCHCPAAVLMLPTAPLLDLRDGICGLVRAAIPCSVRDQTTYAPDPPPVVEG